MRNPDKFRGCLIGGAAGDALGYAVEFQDEKKIFSQYGERGIADYELHCGKALISDDTQMTLFTATGLLAGTTRGKMRGIMAKYSDYIRYSYRDWLRTQNERYPLPEGYHYSWLVNVPELFDRRAPGATCEGSLGKDAEGTIENPINSSKGCGGVMRVAPIGLYFNDRNLPVEEVARIGAEAAAITHGHILGWLPAAALVQIIHEISQNDLSVHDAVVKTLEMQDRMWPDSHHKEYFLSLIRKAMDLSSSDIKDLDAIHQLGEGWVAEETLAIAVYCALKYENDFDSALIVAVNHKGDSDSTGAVCGNILGARLGLQGIPEKYVRNLELKDVILEIADDLYHDCQMSEYDREHRDPVWISKYIEMTWNMEQKQEQEPVPAPVHSEPRYAVPSGIPSVLVPGYLYDPTTHMIRMAATGREVRDLPALKLDLCNRARHIFEREEKTLRSAPEGEVMISDLLCLSHDEFYGLRNMGVKTADETLELIRAWLSGDSSAVESEISYSFLIADSFIVPEYRLFDGTIRNVSSLLEVPDEPVQVLNLSNRASNALKKAGIDCLSQLVSLSTSDLKDLRSLGAMTEAEIREKLKAYLDLHVLNPVAPGVAVRDGLIIRLAGECLVPDQLLSQFDVPQKTKEILSGNGLHLLSDVVSVSRVQLLSLEGLAESDGEALIDEIKAFLDSVDFADPVALPETALEPLRQSKAPQGSVLAEDYCLLNGIIRNRATGRAVPEALVSALKLSPINASLLTAAGYPVVSSLIGLDYDVLMKVHAFREETVCDISRALLQYLQRKNNGQEMPQEVQGAGHFGAEDLLRFFHDHEFDVLSFADIREAFPEIRERLLVPAAAQLIREGVLLQDGDRYSLHHDTLMEYVRKLLDRHAKSLNTRNVNVLLRRLNGESQPEIAKALGGMTRERVRQLEEKAKEVINLSLKAEETCLEEDRWRHLFTTYGGSRELYLKYLHLPESTWNYLGLWYMRGTVSPEEALADESLSVFARRAIEQYVHLKDVRLDGAYIPATRVALEDYVLEKCCRDQIGFDDFCDLYNRFLQEHGITDEDLLITDSVRSTRKNRLMDSDKVLWNQWSRLRWYDIAGGDYTDLFAALNLGQYRDIEVSAAKLFDDNREIMRQYDIRDGYELHNLLKKLHAESENPTLSFGRMPTLAFGHFDRDQAVREIMFALAPVSQDELAEMISLEYGYAVPTVKGSWLGCVQEYYHKGMYSVDYADLPEEHAALLKQELTEDCYLFSEVKEIYSRLVEDADTSLISSYNMKKIGFQVGVGYILQNYPSLEAYLNHLMTGNEGFDMAPLSARFGNLRSFDAYVRRLKNNLDIIEFGENHYISMKFLEKLGMTKEGIREFADRVLAFHASEDFFSWHSLKKAGFRDEIEDIGFSTVFMVSLLKADPRLSWQRVSGTVVFNPKNEPFAIRDFIRFVVGMTGPVGVDELRAEVLEEYGADMTVKNVMDRVYGSEMYFDPVEKKVYSSAEAYEREFE